MESYEFVVPGRAVSVRSGNRAALRAWLERVIVAAVESSPGIPPFWEPNVHLTIVFLSASGTIDVDNIIKPIQDSMRSIFYADDDLVSDVECHRRTFGWTRFPNASRSSGDKSASAPTSASRKRPRVGNCHDQRRRSREDGSDPGKIRSARL
jgi:hypothetical protein